MTTSAPRPLSVVRHSAAGAAADFRATYTWYTWTFGWLGRMLCQTAFFASIGVLLGSPAATRRLYLGTAVTVCVLEAMTVVVSTARERTYGTLPLLVAAPAGLGWVAFGRSLQWPVSGTCTSLVSLLVLGPLFGVHWRPGPALLLAGLVAVTALGTYCFGLALAAVVLGLPDARNLVYNLVNLSVTAVCGAQVPRDFWPGPVQMVSACLPPSYGIEAVVALGSGAGTGPVLRSAALLVITGALWLAGALVAFRVFAVRARRRNSLDRLI